MRLRYIMIWAAWVAATVVAVAFTSYVFARGRSSVGLPASIGILFVAAEVVAFLGFGPARHVLADLLSARREGWDFSSPAARVGRVTRTVWPWICDGAGVTVVEQPSPSSRDQRPRYRRPRVVGVSWNAYTVTLVVKAVNRQPARNLMNAEKQLEAGIEFPTTVAPDPSSVRRVLVVVTVVDPLAGGAR